MTFQEISQFKEISIFIRQRIIQGEEVKPPLVFQIVGSKPVTAAGGSNRYRLLISDGVLIQPFAMLTTELNVLYESNQLEDYTVIQVNRYNISVINRTGASEK